MIGLANRYWTLMALCAVFGVSITALGANVKSLVGIDIGAATGKVTGVFGAIIPEQEEDAKVLRVVDGDTLIARIDGQRRRVRIIGIDAPESVHPERPVQCYAKRASKATRNRLQGKRVKLIYDVKREDRYSRTLAYVELAGRDHGSWMIKRGYARAMAIEPNTSRKSEYSDSEERARSAGRGLWRACAN